MSNVEFSSGAPLSPVTFTPFFEPNRPRHVAVINGSRYPVVSYEIVANAHGATDTATATSAMDACPDFSVELFRGDTVVDANGNLVTSTPTTANALGAAGLPVNVITQGLGTAGAVQQGANTDYYDESPVYVELYSGFPDKPSADDLDISQLKRTFLGICNLYRAVVAEHTVTFPCRTIASDMVDAKVTKISSGQTVVSFLAEQAALYGLAFDWKLPAGADPITISQVLAREFIGGSSYNSALYGKHVWDIAIQGAEFDGAVVWVDDRTNTLHYKDPSLISRGTPINLVYGRDFTTEQSPTMEHDFESKRIRVKVRTYQKRSRMATSQHITSDGAGGFTSTVSTRMASSNPVFGTADTLSTSIDPATGDTTVSNVTGSGGGYGSTSGQISESNILTFPYFVAGLSPAQVNAFAIAKWKELSRLQYRLTFTLPITRALAATLSITSLFNISGLPYQYFNTQYSPLRMTFRASTAGWFVDIEAIAGPLPQGEL